MVLAPWRRALFCSLAIAPVVLGSGCKTGSGWTSPWSAWGGASSPSATALTITKPSTHAPAPNGTGTTQPGSGLASSGGAAAVGIGGALPNRNTTSGNSLAGNNPSATSYAGNHSSGNALAGGVAGYPGTAQATAYPARPASGTQPVGGMQVGNYNMQTPGGYAGASRGTPANPAGYSGGAATAPHNNAAGQAPYGDDYRTASQANAGHYQGPAGGNAPAENPAAAPGEAESVYNGGETATAHEAGTYSGNEETSPVGGNNSPASGPYTNSPPPESTSNRSFGPANTVGPAARTSTSSTSLGGGLPASLSGNGGYRPGSTAGGYGSRNAGYDQPQNGSATEEPAGGIYR